ncbi:hypothetical protein PsorP6_001579 [Peronosclerospora sorghi]|uniref:Uncharacterized protein n=1 Tax=Peronosclerospora sorghi TaxID=230839 RepID=A0ACC0WTZ2_9STRA|nr:hypothetical protein PsorP6_001579 [Peronosclerospora sorghi]
MSLHSPLFLLSTNAGPEWNAIGAIGAARPATFATDDPVAIRFTPCACTPCDPPLANIFGHLEEFLRCPGSVQSSPFADGQAERPGWKQRFQGRPEAHLVDLWLPPDGVARVPMAVKIANFNPLFGFK